MARKPDRPRLTASARLLLAVLALLACWLSAAPTAGAAARSPHHHRQHHHHRKHQRPRPLYWGAWIGSQITGTNAPWDMGAVARFEQIVGKAASLIEFSSPFQDCNRTPCTYYSFPAQAMESVRLHGSIPVFSWGSEATPRTSALQPGFRLADILSGAYDPYIAQFASEAKAWGHPFFLRFDWEMNGNWFPWSETTNGNGRRQFVAAWRHVHDIFSAVGAANATWVWCPFADAQHRFQPLKQLYPGNRYVDWTCMDGYNWGANAVNPQPWRSFSQLFEPTYEELTKRIAPRKPIMLAEFATSPNGGHKAAWIRNMFRILPLEYPRIRALVYFDTVDRGVDWPLETSTTATRAFARGIRKGIYRNNRFAELTRSPIRPPR
jgi:hypothetical protein